MAEEEKLVFVNFWSSPFGSRVKIALEEKCIPYEYREEDLFNKSQFLREVNPVHNKVPVLVHNEKSVCESLNIVEYIDEVWSHKPPQLLPADAYRRSLARFWADFIDKKVYETSKKIYRNKGEDQEAGKQELMGILKLLERELGEKAYFGGEDFGFVDISLIPFYSRFYAWETFGKFNMEQECPILMAWAKRCLQRPSVSRSLPQPLEIYEYIVNLNRLLDSSKQE